MSTPAPGKMGACMEVGGEVGFSTGMGRGSVGGGAVEGEDEEVVVGGEGAEGLQLLPPPLGEMGMGWAMEEMVLAVADMTFGSLQTVEGEATRAMMLKGWGVGVLWVE